MVFRNNPNNNRHQSGNFFTKNKYLRAQKMYSIFFILEHYTILLFFFWGLYILRRIIIKFVWNEMFPNDTCIILGDRTHLVHLSLTSSVRVLDSCCIHCPWKLCMLFTYRWIVFNSFVLMTVESMSGMVRFPRLKLIKHYQFKDKPISRLVYDYNFFILLGVCRYRSNCIEASGHFWIWWSIHFLSRIGVHWSFVFFEIDLLVVAFISFENKVCSRTY